WPELPKDIEGQIYVSCYELLLIFDRLQIELEEKQLSALKRPFEDGGRYWQEIKGDFRVDIQLFH
ncbi:hypothetical protein Tco_1373733, partial [Tanacetum coccineum]